MRVMNDRLNNLVNFVLKKNLNFFYYRNKIVNWIIFIVSVIVKQVMKVLMVNYAHKNV